MKRKIEQLFNSLPENELASFEKRWLSDKYDKAYEEKYSNILTNMGVNREVIRSKPVEAKKFSLMSFLLKIAVLLLFPVTICLFYFNMADPTPKQIASQFLDTKFELYNATKGKDTDNSIANLYSNNDFDNCLKKGLILIEKEEVTPNDYFVMGLACLYQKPADYNLAIESFGQLTNGRFVNEANWYSALAAIQLEDYVSAKKYLNRILESKSSTNKALEDAEKLLESIINQ